MSYPLDIGRDVLSLATFIKLQLREKVKSKTNFLFVRAHVLCKVKGPLNKINK